MNDRRQRNSSWRSIEQTGLRPSGSKEGAKRQKQPFRRLFLVLGVYLLIIGVSISIYFWINSYQGEKKLLSSDQFNELRFESNGCLKKEFIAEYLDAYRSQSLIDVDIFDIKNKLELLPQVKSAKVERVFPKTIVVLLDEYQPVAKIGIIAKNERQILFVGQEGEVFPLIKGGGEVPYHLPFLAGKKIVHQEGKYLPIEGIQPIATLLENARRNKPHLYNDWKIISSEDTAVLGDRVSVTMHVQTKKLGMVTFSSKGIARQLDKLDYISHDIEAKRIAGVKSVDLSLGENATVQLADKKYRNTL